MPHSRDMSDPNDQQPPHLRTVDPLGGPSVQPGSGLRTSGPGVNELAELVADLLAATKLAPDDSLALARGRAGQGGSLAQALIDEGVATSDGIARALAARFGMPLVDLAATGIDSL